MSPDKARKFIVIAKAVAGLSKDPSTKVGAVAINSTGAILSVGYNGFPKLVNDSPERYADRDTKIALVAHAEQNLVAQAAAEGIALRGSTVIISGLYPCSSCTKSLIQAGVIRIITPRSDINPRWTEDAKWSKILLDEANVEVIYIEEKEHS